MIKGFFKVKRSDGKVALKLTGDFDSENINWINQVLIQRKFFRSNFFELDMSEAENISKRSMALLLNALNILKESGTIVRVKGLTDTKLLSRI